MSSKSKTTQQQTAQTQTNATPWNADYLNKLYQTGFDTYGKAQSGAGQLYGQASQSAAHAAQGMQTGSDAATKLATDQLQGKYLDASSNPYLQSAIQAAIDPLQHALLTSTLPAITDQSIAQGAYGGSRNSVANALAIDDFTRQAGNITAQMAGENYANERQIQQGSAGLLGTANNLALAPSQALALAAQLAGQGSTAGLDALIAALSTGPNAVNTSTTGNTSGTSTTKSNDPLGWFQALMAGSANAASAAAGGG